MCELKIAAIYHTFPVSGMLETSELHKRLNKSHPEMVPPCDKAQLAYNCTSAELLVSH